MTDDKARETFKRIRWAATDGEPFCPHCGCLPPTRSLRRRPVGNERLPAQVLAHVGERFFIEESYRFATTSPIIALFVNGVKGTSALQTSRDLNINPKSSFVLLHKLREEPQRPPSFTS